MTAPDIKKLMSKARYMPKLVRVEVDLESEWQFLTLTYEWKSRLSQLSEFMTDVRIDLAKIGLAVTQIELGDSGIAFSEIKSEIDPEGRAFPCFSVKPTEQFRQEYEDFLAVAQALRRRAQEARDE